MNPLMARLPPKARQKLVSIEDAAQEMQALIFNVGRRLSDARAAMNDSKDADAQTIGADIQKMLAVQDRHQDRHRSLAQFCAQTKHYLQNLHAAAVLDDAPSTKTPSLRNETYLRAVERLRASIAEAQAEHSAVMQAAVPVADLKEAARDYVHDLAERGRPKINATHDTFTATYAIRGEGFTPGQDVPAIMAWLNSGMFYRRICSAIDSAHELLPKNALILSKTDRADRLASVTDRLWQLERDEEALIVAASDEGHEITRRPYASPAAVLGVVVRRQGSVAAA